MFLDHSRETTQNFILTLASRLENLDSVIIIAAQKDGLFIHHTANYENIPWANIVGNLEAIKHDILAKKLAWVYTDKEGIPIVDEEEEEAS